jgi:4-diphosphocytidyl-2-C-methyl-D-erythritol kinase
MSDEADERFVAVRAPGKVNLQLSVGALQADRYHPLATVFQAVGLWETVIATPREDSEFTITMDMQPSMKIPDGAVPLDETNLAVRAARAVALRFGVPRGVDLRILKGVPVAGGMAGGSADAAAALVACAEAWGVGATRSELDELAAGLGSDVPFALHGHTAVGQGRGDQLTPAMARGEYHWAFAMQAHGLSTAAVYAEFDRQAASGERLVREPRVDDELMRGLCAGDPAVVGARLSNDLEPSALRLAPHLADTLLVAREAGALGVIVSGSGPTVAALGRSRQHALAIAAAVSAAGVADGVSVASGPAGGATVVASAGGEDGFPE